MRRPKSSKSVYSLGWRAYILELLVLIKASQAAIHRSLDAPLCAYFRTKGSPVHIPLKSAKDYLCNQLTTPERFDEGMHECRQESYEYFIRRCPWPNTHATLRQAFHDDICSKRLETRLQQACIKLYDPNDPDPRPFLRHCDQIAALSENSKLAKEYKMVKIQELSEQCKDASIVLQHQELYGDHSWLGQFSRCRPWPGLGRMIESRSKSSKRLKDMIRRVDGTLVGDDQGRRPSKRFRARFYSAGPKSDMGGS